MKLKSKKVNKSEHSPVKKGEATRSRQRAFIAAYTTNRFSVSSACRTVGIGRTIFYKWLKSSRFFQELDDAKEERLDIAESCLHRSIQAGDTRANVFFLRTQGKKRGYGDKPMPSKEAIDILKKLLAEEITAKEAAYQLHMIGEALPEVLKIELERTPPEPPPPDVPPTMTDEELEKKYQDMIRAAEDQKKTFVPERRAEVEAIKEELKNIDAFSSEAINGNVDKI
ncbi:MAG: hypothetical protein NTV58_15085 [Deltaproteobacteria bacterium]|nr:hypothetical protein [Deltaproteobacteria bacterium]